jgi:CMP-2-keto-3-deoxyoctulosonic acid synthetase
VLAVETQFDSIGVDTPDDLARVRAMLERDDVPVIAR